MYIQVRHLILMSTESDLGMNGGFNAPKAMTNVIPNHNKFSVGSYLRKYCVYR